MAQDRLFHKSLGHGERVNQLSDFEYIVWGCYVLSADDYGVMRFSALTLQSDHDRLASKNTSAIERALSRCVSVGLLGRFEHQGRGYLYQPDWQDYQKVRFPANTTNPLPPADVVRVCTPKTRELYAKHHKFSPSDYGETSEVDPKSLRNSSEVSPREREVLPARNTANANANENANVNGEGKTERPTMPAHVGKQRPIPHYRRLRVFPWMVEEMLGMLGEHADDFDLDKWLLQLDSSGRVLPPNIWPWLKESVSADAASRGFGAVAAMNGTHTNVDAVRELLRRDGVIE